MENNSLKLFQLCVIFFVLIVYYLCDDNLLSGKGKLYKNIEYQCYSTTSIIAEGFAQSNILCAAQCIQTSNCRTVTYYKTNHSCWLYTEFSTLGQFVSNNDTITFETEMSTGQGRAWSLCPAILMHFFVWSQTENSHFYSI